MERKRPTHQNSHRVARTSAHPRATRPHPFRRHRGQPVREDDGKRGQSGQDDIGFDSHKHIKGRKRHLLVDASGLVLSVFVSAADLGERAGAKALFEQVKGQFPRLTKIWADSGYTGPFAEWVAEHLGAELEVVKRTDDLKGFKIVPRRWVVERTFGWFGRYRRLAKDYELRPERSESMIYLAMMRLMLRRLAT